MKPDRLVLATRGSVLARTQSGHVAAAITEATGIPVELKIISTRGDRNQTQALAAIGGKGLFTLELEEGLRSGEVDIAVHSLKDLPTDDPDGLMIGAMPRREDPRDVWVGPPPTALPAGARVGTGSLRRAAQVREIRPDLEVVGIRGNVETRLAKRDRGECDVTILAAAGLRRLEIQRPDAVPLTVEQMVPAVGQGVLGVQCRAGDSRVISLLAAIDDPLTRLAATTERSFLAALGGGCNVPAGCYAQIHGQTITATAVYAVSAAGPTRRESRSGTCPETVGRALAESIRAGS